MKVKYIKIRQMKFRQMKNTALLFIAVMGSFSVQAQQDTASYKSTETKDETVIDSLENLLLVGEYGSSVNADFTFSRFIKKKNKMHAHGTNMFIGYTSLVKHNLSNMGCVNGAVLRQSLSVESGMTAFGLDVRISKKYGWFFYGGIGFKINVFSSDLNTAFKKVDNKTVQVPADSGIFYSHSSIMQWYLQIPLLIEYQKKDFFVQAGIDFGIKLASTSRVTYRSPENPKKVIDEKVGKGMYVNPFSVDLNATIGLGNVAIYARYGLINFFKKGYGAEVVPVSFGIKWYF